MADTKKSFSRKVSRGLVITKTQRKPRTIKHEAVRTKTGALKKRGK